MAPYYPYPANHFGGNDFNPNLMSNTSHSVHPSNYVDTDYQYWHQQNEIWAWQEQNQSEVQMGENHYMNQDWSRPGYIQKQQEIQDSRMVQNQPVFQGWAPQLHIQNQPEVQYHPVNQGWAPQGQTQPEVQDPRMVQNHPINKVWAPPGHIQNQPEFQNHPVNQVWAPQEQIQRQPEVQDRQLVQTHQDQEAHQRRGKKRQIQNKQQKVQNDSKKVTEGYKFYCEQCRQWFKTDVHFKRGKCKNCK